MNQLDAGAASGNDEGLDFINHDTRFDILENKVTLCVPEGNPKVIQGFDDMAQKLDSASLGFTRLTNARPNPTSANAPAKPA
ncbi:molybdate transport system substrate-binding protein [Parafannyhessea umbonata]|uniref:Molybdate transport system substrate-binding protein n=1 Tax=Parafannyhessea umbonata TaxID=604330 RepID=A0A1G6J2Q5_9ACTN|nr:molybdate transport system substrate-binding protein [Parafannyhessea umbonata]